MTFPRLVRTSQPKVPVGIDWSNPLTVGLLSVMVGRNANSVLNGSRTNVGSSQVVAGFGVSAKGFTSAPTIPDSLPNGSLKKLSVFALVRNPTDTSAHNIFADTVADGLQVRTSAGAIQLVRKTVAVSITAGTVANTETFSVAATVTGTVNKLYKNGLFLASDATNPVSASTSALAVGSDGSGGNFWSGDIGFIATFDRVLSDAEIKSLSENPWQIFQPAARAIWVPVGTASAPEVSGALTTENNTVTASASVSPVASSSLTAADATFTGTSYTSPVASASITTADSTVAASASTSAAVAGALSTEASTVSASAFVSPVATASVTAADSTFAGDASSGSSVASMSITTEDAFAAAVASVSPVALMAVYTDDAAVSGSAQGQVTGVYPDPATVLAGVAYGPSGADYTGTLAWSSASDISAALLAALQATAIPVNMTQVRGQTIGGSGSAVDPWGPS